HQPADGAVTPPSVPSWGLAKPCGISLIASSRGLTTMTLVTSYCCSKSNRISSINAIEATLTLVACDYVCCQASRYATVLQRSPGIVRTFFGGRRNLSLVQKQGTFLAMRQCPLSLWERVRVRVPRFCAPGHGPSPPALSRGERELWHAPRGSLVVH